MVAVRQEPPGQPELDISNVIAAFSEDQVERITGLNKGRLRYWARTDFFRPSFVEDNLRLAYSRFYSFKDIVALRTLEVLRIQHSVPLQHLRKVAEKLVHLKDELWTKTSFVCRQSPCHFPKSRDRQASRGRFWPIPAEHPAQENNFGYAQRRHHAEPKILRLDREDPKAPFNCPQRVVDRRNTNHCWFNQAVP